MSAPDLTAIALAGVSASPSAELTTGAPIDTLPLPGEDRGRDVLLRAGSAAVYRLAGRVAITDVALPEPAPTEARPLCSTEAAALLSTLLGNANYNDLLIEAFTRMARVGAILPPTLVPLALANVTFAARPTLLPLIGERGRWLGQHNPQWAWAAVSAAASDTLPSDAEIIWQEGSKEQRIAVLAAMRSSDPARARAWLSAVWKKEGVKIRETMLETFWKGLGMDDEEFLESVLNTAGDRAEQVRATAANMLASLPGSALAARMRARADVVLSFTDGKLDAAPPKAADEQWTRDGLTTRVISQKNGQRAFWLRQILEHVPPKHWVERFSEAPGELIAATVESQWRLTILQGWSDAADRFQDHNWAEPLWNAWLTFPRKNKTIAGDDSDLASRLPPLATLLPPNALEAFVTRMIGEPDAHAGLELYEALDWLPQPWSADVARAYLDGLRKFVTDLTASAKSAEPWDDTLERAALALPEEFFAEASEPLSTPESKHWSMTRFNTMLTAFAEKIQMRERIKKVIEQ